jgi:hypothetical protein
MNPSILIFTDRWNQHSMFSVILNLNYLAENIFALHS